MKSPKIYLRDSGLLHHLLNLETLEEVRGHPVHGASWETFVFEDLIRWEKLRHPHAQFYFWRTADGAEINLTIERGSERVGDDRQNIWEPSRSRPGRPKGLHPRHVTTALNFEREKFHLRGNWEVTIEQCVTLKRRLKKYLTLVKQGWNNP